MHITPQDGSSSTKKKEKDLLAFKASQEKGKTRLEYESSSDDEVDDESLALMVKKTAKMLKKLNKWHQVRWQEEEVLHKFKKKAYLRDGLL